jgi:outer membrane protein TolC
LTAAYLNNPTLLGQRAKVHATDEEVPPALSNWRPSISLSGSISRSGVRERLKIRRLDKEQMRNPAGVSLAGIVPFVSVFGG